ncbi:MAG: thiamine pyrophosphate-dependent enzyme [Burkholderiales bacterium]|nr:thiamine pyrophosphate-dependent enzyme [Burkholderiales bacterium]
MMKRDQCLKLLAKYHRDELVVPVYQATFEWLAIKPDAPTFTAVGAMGQASSLALGLALGLPERRVIVLDGDGSLLMNLGSLVTIANAAPGNLLHFVCENGTYEANGGHPIPGKDKLSFAGLARAAGYREAHEFAALDALEAALPGILRATGPVLVDLKVEPGESYPQDWAYMHGSAAREKFRAAVRQSRGA